MCSTFNFTSPLCRHWIFSVQMFDKKKDLWSLQRIHRHRKLLHESHPFDKFLLSFFCCSSTFCLLLLWCTAHLERCDTSNFDVTKVFSPFSHAFNRFQQVLFHTFSPSYTIQSAILHWWAFSITDTLASPKTQISAPKSSVGFTRQLRHLSYSSTTCRKWSSRLPIRKEGRNGHKRLAIFIRNIRNYKLNCQPFVVTLRYLKASC